MGDLVGAEGGAIAEGGPDDQLVGMGLDLGVEPLIGAGDDGIALFQLAVDAAVATRPIGMFAKKTDAARHE
jgi:hypothetical protein